MSCEIPAVVENYLRLVESNEPRACKEQHALAAYVRRVFAEEDIRVDEKLLEQYLRLPRYFSFKQLFPWQEFLIALGDCTFTAEGHPRWDEVFAMLARGGGKDGFIAVDAMCMTSPYNPVQRYNVDICANNEDQAMRPVTDLVDTLETPEHEAKLVKHYYHTKEVVKGRKNKGVVTGHTNNPKGRDGLRPGKVIFNEVHQYENYDNIKVFVSALGKVGHPRRWMLTSNGHVNDGPLDDYLERGRAILFEGAPDKGFLPFICCLKSVEEVHEEANWYMANPSLAYLPTLLAETKKEYDAWLEHPEQNGDFLAKRMGLRVGFKELAVTDYEKVLATNKPLPDLRGWTCTVGVDFAELSDWAAVNFHFRRGNERYDINHAWVCLQSKTLPRIKAPWQAWAEQGHLTVVDDVSIPPELITDYIQEMGRLYSIKVLAMDQYRLPLLKMPLERIGFFAGDKTKFKLVRPSDIMQVEPVVQECFDRGYFHWGDCPPLRWAVNNTKRIPSGKKQGTDTGNYYYGKIEAKSRKTDPWMAVVASMVAEPALGDGAPIRIPSLGAIVLR